MAKTIICAIIAFFLMGAGASVYAVARGQDAYSTGRSRIDEQSNEMQADSLIEKAFTKKSQGQLLEAWKEMTRAIVIINLIPLQNRSQSHALAYFARAELAIDINEASQKPFDEKVAMVMRGMEDVNAGLEIYRHLIDSGKIIQADAENNQGYAFYHLGRACWFLSKLHKAAGKNLESFQLFQSAVEAFTTAESLGNLAAGKVMENLRQLRRQFSDRHPPQPANGK